jgi:serine/threonine protein kinase
MPEPFHVPGFSLLRLISDRERSKLFLARNAAGGLCAIKLQQPREPAQLASLARRVARLQPLTRHEGLLEILAHGTTEQGWAWKALPLADNVSGLPSLDTEPGVQQYTPLNLLAWRSNGSSAPPSAKLVAEWGVRLADALAALHDAGLVHRDVKPANVVFLQGKPCLGDYGLVGEPGEQVDYRGTEGFQPLEGTSDLGADLFALGKTLYETWTGGNRLEFPSLPREVLDAPEWDLVGSHLNEVILKACSGHARKRFRSAAEISVALANVVSGRRPINRRRWLATAAAASVLGPGLFFAIKHWRAPGRVVWRRVRQKGLNVESWQGHSGTVDWVRGRIYSFAVDGRGDTFQILDLKSFDLVSRSIPGGPTQSVSTLFHPHLRELWIIEGGRGEVFALNPETLALRSRGGGPLDERHFATRTYWNPLTGRVGIFGGYGHLSVCNDRSEFDPVSKSWVEVEPDREDSGPWRRTCGIPLAPNSAGNKLYLVGGCGSKSGKQGERMENVPCFTGQFHMLDDIWELDLRANAWRCLLPLGSFDPLRIKATAYFPQIDGLVIIEGMKPEDIKPRAARCWLLRPGIDKQPIQLPSKGEASRLSTAWTYTTDPRNGELLMFADDGIFRIAVLHT